MSTCIRVCIDITALFWSTVQVACFACVREHCGLTSVKTACLHSILLQWLRLRLLFSIFLPLCPLSPLKVVTVRWAGFFHGLKRAAGICPVRCDAIEMPHSCDHDQDHLSFSLQYKTILNTALVCLCKTRFWIINNNNGYFGGFGRTD